MKVSKTSKYQTHKKSIKLTKNANDPSGGPGAICIFQHPLLQNIKTMKGGPFGDFFRKKSRSAEKLKGDTLVSPGIVCYPEKEENLFGSVC